MELDSKQRSCLPGSQSAEEWFAIRVRSNCENVVARALEHKGNEVFLPKYELRKDRAEDVVRLQVPLFPGYLFCRFDLSKRQNLVITPGLVHIVGSGRTPIPVPDHEIESIMRMTQSDRGLMPCPYVRDGDIVRITSGAMRGLEGLLISTKKGTRLVLSITLLQRSVWAEVDADCVEFVRRGVSREVALEGLCA